MVSRVTKVVALSVLLVYCVQSRITRGDTITETFDTPVSLDGWTDLVGSWPSNVSSFYSTPGVTSVNASGEVKLAKPRGNGGVWVDLINNYEMILWEEISFDVKRISKTPQSVDSTWIGIPIATGVSSEPNRLFTVLNYNEGLEGTWMNVHLKILDSGTVSVKVINSTSKALIKSMTIPEMNSRVFGFWATLYDTFFDNFEITGLSAWDIDGISEEILTLDLPKALETSLTTRLSSVRKLLLDSDLNNDAAACESLSDMIIQIENQKGTNITEDQADFLITAINAVLSTFSC